MAAIAVLGAGAAAPLAAQTDYYNTSAGRPLRVEDAQPVEFRAIEFDMAPLRLERARAGTYRWSFHPEFAVGLLPRTQVQLGFPLTYVDDVAGRPQRGLAGIELSVLHSLNAETAIPALAVAADVLVPAGGLGGDAAYATLKGIITRTLPWARFHANAGVTVGPTPVSEGDESASVHADGSRWLAGVSIDKTFPLRSLLVGAELVAEQPLERDATVAWTAGTGLRYQLTPRWALDAGVGRRFDGDDPAWYVTFGSAFAIGIP